MTFSLYFHIPFCTKKCDYCHFYVIPDKEPFKELLMEGFSLELAQSTPKFLEKQLISIYFGGGTPSLLGPEKIAKILSWIPFDLDGVEITLEANPENITKELMQGYAAAGINRISIGIQSFDDDLLKALGRTHNSAKAFEAVVTTAQAGIDNISIDLMYDLPRQDLNQWKKTLERAKELPITHLSLYNLTIEPHTSFYKKRQALQSVLPNEEQSLEMYETAIEQLAEVGLKQYEISAFAKEDKGSKHNIGYWTGRSFLGFGPSAFSYWEGKRFRVVSNLNRYIQDLRLDKNAVDFEEELCHEAKQRELLAVNLRLLEGVDLEKFQKKQGCLSKELNQILVRLEEDDYLESDGSVLKMTKKGILFYDTLASEIIL